MNIIAPTCTDEVIFLLPGRNEQNESLHSSQLRWNRPPELAFGIIATTGIYDMTWMLALVRKVSRLSLQFTTYVEFKDKEHSRKKVSNTLGEIAALRCVFKVIYATNLLKIENR